MGSLNDEAIEELDKHREKMKQEDDAKEAAKKAVKKESDDQGSIL